MGRRYLSLGKVGVLTNRDVRDAVQGFSHSNHSVPAELVSAQNSGTTTTTTPQKRPREQDAAEEPQRQEPAHALDRMLHNRKLKMAFYGREDDVFDSEEKLGPDMAKYWAQRYRLWSRYDEGIRMDKEGWWSVTPEAIAIHQAKRLRSDLVVDAFCGCGGNSIQLAMTCKRVIAIDNNAFRLACAAHNAEIYGVADRITFVLADFREWAASYQSSTSNEPIDAVFLSPPWGGLDYLLPGQEYSLNSLIPPGVEILSVAQTLSRNLALFIPRNTDPREIGQLVDEEEQVEIEETYMSGKLKALTAYFGDLKTSAS